MLRNIRTKVFYPHPPERVWQAIANRRALAAWLMDNDFEPRLGHKFRFQTQPLPGLEGTIHCEVIELEEPRRLSYTWRGGNLSKHSIVTWTLEPVDGGTQLQLEHKGFECEVIKLGQPMHFSRTGQDNSVLKASLDISMQQPVNQGMPLQLGHAQLESFDSVALNFSFSGGWDFALNSRLQKVLTEIDRQLVITEVRS
jgi:uncharacterized protein YndB with AHSA1/START domain